jgi:hypothetical protein
MVAVVVLCSGADDLDKIPHTGIGWFWFWV